MNSTTRQSQFSGFTLIELMIAIAIIAILSTLAIVAYNYYIVEAQHAVLEEEISEMHHAAELYVATSGKLPASMQAFGEYNQIGELSFTIQADPTDTHKARIIVKDNNQKIPFVINLANQSNSLCWDCITASAAGISSTDSNTDMYIPMECRTVNSAMNCTSAQQPATHSAGQPKPVKADPTAAKPDTDNIVIPTIPLDSHQSTDTQQHGCDADMDMIMILGFKACAKKCPAGQVRDTANILKCVTPAPQCSDSQELLNNQCVAKCASNEQRDGNGQCQMIIPICNASQELLNNQCVTKCANGETRNAYGQCVSVCRSPEIWQAGRCCNPHDNHAGNKCRH